MGPNALVGAGVILLACLVAQSEQIVQLVGRGGGKDNDEPLIGLDRGVDEAPQDEGEGEELSHLPGFDEADPAVESEIESMLDVPTVQQEYTLPAGIYVEGSPFAERENVLHSSNDVPAVRVGWFGSIGPG